MRRSSAASPPRARPGHPTPCLEVLDQNLRMAEAIQPAPYEHGAVDHGARQVPTEPAGNMKAPEQHNREPHQTNEPPGKGEAMKRQ